MSCETCGRLCVTPHVVEIIGEWCKVCKEEIDDDGHCKCFCPECESYTEAGKCPDKSCPEYGKGG